MLTLSQKWLLILGALMGCFSVAVGAFGAHALKNRLTEEMLSVFEVGARYQMYHAIAIWLSVWFSTLNQGMLALFSGWTFFIGSLVFSGSLYLLALTGIRIFGAITPIGGIFFLVGWLCLALAAFKSI